MSASASLAPPRARWDLRLALAAVSATWIGALVFAPVLPVTLAGLLYAFCSLICHQLPERSFYVADAQLPVCARCLGIYAGAALGAIAAAVRPVLTFEAARPLLLAAALPTLATVLLESTGVWGASNLVRATTGVLLGVAAVMTVAASLRTVERSGPVSPEPLNS